MNCVVHQSPGLWVLPDDKTTSYTDLETWVALAKVLERGKLTDEAARAYRGSIYPAPDLAMPFLGVHLTKGVDGSVWAGPTALPAFGRENYGWLKGARVEERDHAANGRDVHGVRAGRVHRQDRADPAADGGGRP